MMKIKNTNIDLKKTITCGQIFRYKTIDNKYIIILKDRVVEIYEDDNYIYIDSSNMDNIEEVVNNYFDLNRDYINIQNKLINIDPSLENIINTSKNLKIIQQYPFETMISYIISTNNSVRNIQKAVNLISNKYGDKVLYKNKEYYLFPTIKELKVATIEDLNNLKLGFRSKYIYEFINNITEDKINFINNLNTEDALNYLMQYKGIGLKVASCILMFSYS
ncbi:MAG TPA: DNA glycosylase, partial [Bacilli bacterium]|nr:DNA glycosylase [Bacilli bacterium]